MIPTSMPVRRAALGALALVAATACGSTLTDPELPAGGAPDAFAMRVDGFGFGAHVVTLRGDTLVVERRPDWRVDSARIARVVPTSRQWAEFWRAADAVGVRRWPRACRNARIVDGGGFTLELAYSGVTLASQGTNSFPQRDGGCTRDGGASPEYEAFVRAVSALIGRPFP